MPESTEHDQLHDDLDRLVDMDVLGTWESDFCIDIMDLIESGRTLTTNQLDRCRDIVNTYS